MIRNPVSLPPSLCRSCPIDSATARSFCHDAAGHDQDFLVGERYRFPELYRRQDCFEGLRSGRRAQHELGVRVRRDRHQSIAPCSSHRHVRGEGRGEAIERSARPVRE